MIYWAVFIFGSPVEPRKTQSEFMPNFVKQNGITFGTHLLKIYVDYIAQGWSTSFVWPKHWLLCWGAGSVEKAFAGQGED